MVVMKKQRKLTLGFSEEFDWFLRYQPINPILIQVYPHKWGWPDLPHSNNKFITLKQY